MELLKFKTTVTTVEEVARVAPFLNQLPAVEKWDIAPETEHHVLSISGHNLDPQQIENGLREAGFRAELLRVLGVGGDDL
ncbi:copper chaperone [Hymenobacter sp. BT186]|uniref:Copper chaperone n=1 Tax=Hymenobacter telluris TaxID=2816474 RepID=A0A939F0H5_9BACT|nr:copper chaperone [Hymenobacter telluris]MBO0360496.1 copper chaperone [Hymenobacter telluris]MBW3376523.1 copper chaperone [Hymenobacter norwichensis]